MAAPAFAQPNPNEYGDRIISSPAEHAAQLHAGGGGLATIAIDYPSAGWREYTRPVERIPRLAQRYAGAQVDAYVSMQEFHGRRCVANLVSLRSLYVDLDYEDIPELRQYGPHEVLDMVLSTLADAGISPPTLAVASGSGLHLIWQFSPIRAEALPRWQAVEKHLVQALAAYGADPAVTDPARVLRLVGTKNVHREVTSLLPVGEVYSFNQLADSILPRTRAELRDLRARKARKAAEKPRASRPKAPEGYGSESLGAALMEDMHAFVSERGPSMRNHRRRAVYYYAVGAAKALSSPEAVRAECRRFGAEVCGWSEHQADTALGTVFDKTEAAYRGEKVEYEGRQVDPRYTFRAEDIIEDLCITPREQKNMRVLISQDERRRRRREKERARQREAGRISREDYEGRAAQRRSEARRLSSEGYSRREIAESLGVSPASVTGYLKAGAEAPESAGPERGSKSVAVSVPPRGAVRAQELRESCWGAPAPVAARSLDACGDSHDLVETRYQRLRALLGHRVRTKYGDGRMWQTFRNQVGVVLDSNLGRVEFIDPVDIEFEKSEEVVA